MKKLILAIPVGLPSVAVTALVAYFSLSSDPVAPDMDMFPGCDKVCHFIMYFVTALVYFYDYTKKKFPHHTKLNKDLFITAVTMLLGLLMESGQMVLNNGRAFEWLDIVANWTGAVLAFGVARLWLMHEYRKFIGHKHHHHHRHHRKK
ncbi:MAG: VanZ family protein [Bacteroidales bacterium]|nr:VanZ family protein [Candidatus Sodaliphilus fimicaballi]